MRDLIFYACVSCLGYLIPATISNYFEVKQKQQEIKALVNEFDKLKKDVEKEKNIIQYKLNNK